MPSHKVADFLAGGEALPASFLPGRDRVQLRFAGVLPAYSRRAGSIRLGLMLPSEHRDTRYAPLLSLEFLARPLGGDHEGGNSDEDDTERFERRLEVAIVWVAAIEEVGGGEGECEAPGEALEPAHDCSTLLSVLLFLRYDLRFALLAGHHPRARRMGLEGTFILDGDGQG